MISSKIKKHFSLFMVQKSIKKPHRKGEIEENFHNKEKKLVSIPKFIDPINCLHLYGDIIFIDKLNEDDIGIVSKYENFKRIVNIEFHEDSNSWTTALVTPSFEPDSWRLVYDRLTSLGNLSAYELAKTIEKFFLSMEDQFKQDKQEKNLKTKSLELISQVKYHQYLKDVQNFLKNKTKNIYLFLMFEIHSLQKGLELKKIGYSKKLVDLVWEDEFRFAEYTMNFSFYDFLTIKKEYYFDFIKNNFLRVFEQNNLDVKFTTLDGIHTNLAPPTTSTKFCTDENGNMQGLFIFYDFSVEEKFLINVAQSREKTTKISKRRKLRDDLLEEILKYYYGKGEITQNFQDNSEHKTDINLQDQNEKKRCGYRIL